MRRFTPLLTTAALQNTPMVELWDGGGELPYLGSSGSYNATPTAQNLAREGHTGDKELILKP